MRVTSALWVSALLRRAQEAGAFAVVLRKGNEQAGAVFVVVDDRSGKQQLIGPAPQTMYDEGLPAERMFETVMEGAEPDDIAQRIEREVSFDPDVWVIEIEDRQGRSFTSF